MQLIVDQDFHNESDNEEGSEDGKYYSTGKKENLNYYSTEKD